MPFKNVLCPFIPINTQEWITRNPDDPRKKPSPGNTVNVDVSKHVPQCRVPTAKT